MTKIKRINKKTKRRKRFLFRKKTNTKKIYRKLKKKFTFRKRKYVKKIRRKGKKTRKRIQRGGIIRRGNPDGNVDPNHAQYLGRNTMPPYPYWALPAHFHSFPGAQYLSTSIEAIYHGGNGPQELYATGLPDQCVTGAHANLRGVPAGMLVGGPGRGCDLRSRLGRTMAYFMYVKGVKNWISLQACGQTYTQHHFANAHPILDAFGHQVGFDPGICQGDPGGTAAEIRQARVEDNTWRELRNFYTHAVNGGGTQAEITAAQDVNPVDNILIADMTVGTMDAWNRLAAYGNIFDHANATAIHCYAGWGRTGAAMFFYIFRNAIITGTIANFHQPWLGYTGSNHNSGLELYDHLRTLMNKGLDWHDIFLDPNRHAHQTLTAGSQLSQKYNQQTHGQSRQDVITTLNRITRASPIDKHAGQIINGVYTFGVPPTRAAQAPAIFAAGHPNAGQRNPNAGSWENYINGQRRTSDMVHEVFNVSMYSGGGIQGNFKSNIFIGRINTMLIQIWAYLYIGTPARAPHITTRPLGWDQIWLYILPTCPLGNPNTWTPAGAATAANTGNTRWPPTLGAPWYGGRTNPLTIFGRNTAAGNTPATRAVGGGVKHQMHMANFVNYPIATPGQYATPAAAGAQKHLRSTHTARNRGLIANGANFKPDPTTALNSQHRLCPYWILTTIFGVEF